METTNTEIRVAEILKTFNTIGEVRYVCNFTAVKDNYVFDRISSQHKSEASALKKLNSLITKYGAHYADSCVYRGVKRY